MLTSPKLMLPFQIARAMENLLFAQPGTQDACRCSLAMGSVRAIQSFFGPGVHPFFLAFTGLGTGAFLWIVLFLYSWLIDPRFGRRLGVVFAASILSNHALKLAFGTQRPYEIDSPLA